MGKRITLICDETPGLKLGPGAPPGYHDVRDGDPGVIIFVGGYAEFDEDQFPSWRQWVEAKGSPHIEVVEGAEGQVPSAYGLGFDCPECGKAFASQPQLNGHRVGAHRRAPVPA